MTAPAAVDSTVDFAGIPLRNPVLTASGTFGYGVELRPHYDPPYKKVKDPKPLPKL